jgi:phosphatidylglycerophosphatase A
MRQLIIFLATGAYSGYSPFASGTAGSAVGLIVVYFACAPLWNHAPILFVVIYAIGVAISCWLAGRADEIFAEHDSSKITIDEVLGMIATMYLLPMTWQYLLAGFILFRALDVLKPFPAAYFDEKVPGGPGVVLDDVFAGIYANILIRAAAHFF